MPKDRNHVLPDSELEFKIKGCLLNGDFGLANAFTELLSLRHSKVYLPKPSQRTCSVDDKWYDIEAVHEALNCAGIKFIEDKSE